MRSVLVLFVFLVMSCQERNDSSVASGSEETNEETLTKQSYFAAFHLRPVQVEDNDESTGNPPMGEQSATGMEQPPIKVVIKVQVKDNKPHSLLVKEVTSVADLNNPTDEEIPEDDRTLLLIMPHDDKIGHKGSRKYTAGHIEDDEEKNYELHWFSGTWKQNRKQGDSQERGPISDTSVARFVIRVGDVEYANVDDSFKEDSVFDNRLVLSAEEIAEKYFATETDDDLLAHRDHENISSEDNCGELLKPYIGYNVYRIDRETCQDDDEATDDGFLLVRASVGVAKHLTGIGDGTAITCRVAEVNGLQLESAMHTSDMDSDAEDEDNSESGAEDDSDGNTKELFASSSCSDKLIDIQAKTVVVSSVTGVTVVTGFLTIKVTKDNDETRTVWLKNNKISDAGDYHEALLAKFQKEATRDMGGETSETSDPPAEPPADNPSP